MDDSKFDEFMGNDAGALASFGEYDQDDREADAEWDRVDDIMDERRRDRREKLLKEELEKYRAANPKIVEQLAPYKRKLAEITDAEWEAIPEIGDYTIKKQKRMESFVPVPDTLLAKAAAEKVGALLQACLPVGHVQLSRLHACEAVSRRLHAYSRCQHKHMHLPVFLSMRHLCLCMSGVQRGLAVHAGYCISTGCQGHEQWSGDTQRFGHHQPDRDWRGAPHGGQPEPGSHGRLCLWADCRGPKRLSHRSEIHQGRVAYKRDAFVMCA